MNNKVKQTILDFNMLQKGDRVIVALSGGRDSVVLLHLLLAQRPSLGVEVMACHLNHLLRGEQAQGDERFAASLCEEAGIPFFCRREDVFSLAQQMGCSLEEAGRRARYAFFEQLSKEHGAKIATAHHLGDAAETFLLNLCRGTGLRGLCSIPPARGSVIRPLIEVSPQEIEHYAVQHQLSWRHDATNDDLSFSRNRIRHSVMPQLTDFAPHFYRSFLRTQRTLREEEAYLENETLAMLQQVQLPGGLSVSGLCSLPGPMLPRVVRTYLKKNGFSPEAEAVKKIVAMLHAGEGRMQISGGVDVKVGNGIFSADLQKEEDQPFCVAFRLGTSDLPNGKRLIAERIELEENNFQKFHKNY